MRMTLIASSNTNLSVVFLYRFYFSSIFKLFFFSSSLLPHSLFICAFFAFRRSRISKVYFEASHSDSESSVKAVEKCAEQTQSWNYNNNKSSVFFLFAIANAIQINYVRFSYTNKIGVFKINSQNTSTEFSDIETHFGIIVKTNNVNSHRANLNTYI